jgi:hypothetical protein
VLRNLLFAAVVMGLGVSGCAGCQQPGPDDGGSGGGAGGSGGAGGGGGFDLDGGLATSSKGVVRFKRNVRLTVDFAQALGLTTAEVCNELGLYPCTTVVHALNLGGVDPYGSGLCEPIPFTGVTSPIVTDRVALAACTTRVTRDLATPAFGLIYKLIAIDGTGKLVNVDSTEVGLALDTLYQRTVLRDATPEEKAHHKQLYADIVASGQPDPAKAWMILSCFAVTTSVEFLFY